MKKFLLLLALISQTVLADDCQVRQASKVTAERQMGNIDDLVKIKSHQKCQVKFSIVIDGEKHNVNWTHEDYGDPEISCQKAIEYGMSELNMRLGGKYQSESMLVCGKGTAQNRPWKIGDEGLENEFGMVANKKYFKFKGANCRYFSERYNNGRLQFSKGVICQNDQLWSVVDKW
jgi:hypothetical protein